MAILLDVAGQATGNTLTVSATSAGNLILAYCSRDVRGTGTAIPVPTGYTAAAASVDDGTNVPWLVAWRFASKTTADNISRSDGSASNNNVMVCYSGNFEADPIGAIGFSDAIGVTSPILYGDESGSGITLEHVGGTSWMTLFITASGATASPRRTLPPTGYTQRGQVYDTTNGEWAIHDSNGPISSFTNLNGPSFSGTTNYSGVAIEVKEIPTGRLNITLNADTLSATGQQDPLPNKGVLNLTLNADTLDATGQLTIQATLNKTLAADTLSATGKQGGRGNLNVLLAADTMDSFGVHPISGSLNVTLNADTLDSLGQHLVIGNLDVTLNADTLSATGSHPHVGYVNVTLNPDTLFAEGQGVPLQIGLDGCTNSLAPVASKECCIPNLCEIDVCTLVCQFVNLLPRGPMWDKAKQQALDYFSSQGACVGDVNIPSCLYSKDLCSSIVVHSVYTAVKLHDILLNALWPALRESSPYTAYDTLDDWLAKFQWKNCFETTCRNDELGSLTPYEVGTLCGAEYCGPVYPDCLEITLKHNILIALQRLQRGIIPNVAAINWVIESLGARLIVVPIEDPDCAPCPMQYDLVPTTNFFDTWQREICVDLEPKQCRAWFDPNECENRGLPSRIYPGLLAAECIVRSVIPRCGVVHINRVCTIPSDLTNPCSNPYALI